MAIRDDITVNFELTPRVATVASPSVELSVQDMHDTLASIEDSVEGHQFDGLISSAGKEDLGGGVLVGITSELQNAQVTFEDRSTSTSSGVISTPDANGQTLISVTSTFQTDGIVRGDLLVNGTDASHATVLEVVSETELFTTVLRGGTDNQYDTSDTITLWPVFQCALTGGNVVAVDDVDAELNPVLQSFGTQIIRSSSSSATLQDLELTNIRYQIESLRQDHQGFGEAFFVDLVNGTDGNSGATDESPVKTIQWAHDNLVVSGRNDVINVINKTGAATVTIADTTISKHEVHIRGAGRSIGIMGSVTNGTMFTIDGNNCSIDALFLDGDNVSDYCVVINGRHFKMTKPWIKQALQDNILIRGGDYHEFISLESEKAGGAGLATFDAELASGSPREITISDNSNIYLNTGDGIRLDSVLGNPAGTSTRLIRIRGNTNLSDNTGYGIEITGNVSGCVISEEVSIFNNTAGAVSDSGINTQDFRIHTTLSNITALSAAAI